ncbi:Transmembrane protein-like protein [Emericellopsis cladophorae]|uniref:Transmembrane protein-like protein n=1 Tax=Emericellopsis cladophorae TaxID=2686198 RepID=A0A9P9Y2R4_9HYPO|nr:Transmembrane protein-like protein [Emericellopsis cladophorae]KAI6782088.1 Transmembrane protein-like protein [Emericellopsis cladophorae]
MKLIIAVPAICALVIRAYSKNSLTTPGLVVAALTAVAHAYHPWNLPFVLLVVFFLAGTRVTHIKQDVKAKLTVASKGSSGGEGPRTHVQVLANSLVASVLTVLHANQLYARQARVADANQAAPAGTLCYAWGGDILIVGIIANYAAVAADTFSSELGILAKSEPRLITSPTLRKVPRGTNGAVTLWGLGAGLFGSMVIVSAATVFLPFCSDKTVGHAAGGSPWTQAERRMFMGTLVIWGALGSVLDSILGGLFQRSVRDVRSGKMVEGEGGVRVLVSDSSAKKLPSRAQVKQAVGDKTSDQLQGSAVETPSLKTDAKHNPMDKHRRSSFGDEQPSRVVESGWDLLDNNDVNFLMAVTMSVGAMAGASWYFGIPVQDVLKV